MKTLINITCLLIGMNVMLIQNATAQTPMKKGTQVIQLGIGIGGAANLTGFETPYIIGAYEMGLIENLGPGNLSVGATVGYKSGNDRGATVAWNFNYFAIAAKSSYHPHFVNSDKFDFYAGLAAGYEVISSDFEGTYVDEFDFTVSDFLLTAHIGARYNFTENFGAWAELGYGMGNLMIGAAYSF